MRLGCPQRHHARASLLPLLSRSTPAPAPDTLAAILIATDEIELVGTVAPTGQRITDLLLRGQDLAFLPHGADPAPDAWISISPPDILWVAPPPLPDRDGAVASRSSGQRIFVRIGPYRIIGVAHLAPATSIDHRLAIQRPFLPLTSASVARETEHASGAVEDMDVVIVNLARASDRRAIG